MTGFIDYKKWTDWWSYYYYKPLEKSMNEYIVETTFDSQKGFEEERPERVMIATEKEMEGGRLRPKYRNYCAHAYLKLLQCKDLHPFRYGAYCHHQEHEVVECEFEDIVIRMKEYERERRLQERENRREKKAKLKEHMA